MNWRRYPVSQGEFPSKVRLEEVPAIVYLFPEDWTTRKTFLSSDYERIKLSYHDAHYAKKRLTVAAIFALFVEMNRAGDVEFKIRSSLRRKELAVRLTTDETRETDDIYGKFIDCLSYSQWTDVGNAVADLLPDKRVYV